MLIAVPATLINQGDAISGRINDNKRSLHFEIERKLRYRVVPDVLSFSLHTSGQFIQKVEENSRVLRSRYEVSAWHDENRHSRSMRCEISSSCYIQE